MENSHLNKVPGELRNDIYKLVFANNNRFFHYRADHVPVYANKHTGTAEGTQQHPLLQVCRRMREETNEFYYSCNDFLFPVCFLNPNAPMLDAWFTTLGGKRCVATRCVTLMLWHWEMMLGSSGGIDLCTKQCRQMWRVVFKHNMQKKIQIVGNEMRHRALRGEDNRTLFRRGQLQDQEKVLNGMVKIIFLEVAAELDEVKAKIKISDDTATISKAKDEAITTTSAKKQISGKITTPGKATISGQTIASGKKRKAPNEPLRRSKRIRAMTGPDGPAPMVVEEEKNEEVVQYDAAFYATMRKKVDDRVFSDEDIARSKKPVDRYRPSTQHMDEIAAELNEMFPST